MPRHPVLPSPSKQTLLGAGVWTMKLMTAALAVCIATSGLSVVTAADAAVGHFDLNIPREPLDGALRDLAQQTGMQVARFTDHAKDNLLVGPLYGSYSTDEALKTLLGPTGLSYRPLNERGYIVATPEALAAESVASSATRSPASITPSKPAPVEKSKLTTEGKAERSFSGPFRMAQAGSGYTTGNVPVAKPESSSSAHLEEVVVTAEKRNERLQDVPSAVTAVSGDRLEWLKVSTLSNLANYVPGMSVQDGGAPGARQISIRGLNTSAGNNTNGPTVGMYIDDLAVSCASASPAGARCALYGADLNPYDVKQIEVLKGPQGTLYGDNSLAGVVKYTLYKPSLTQFDARVGGDLEHTSGTNAPNGQIRAAVNLPIAANRVAVRLSSFYKTSAGYLSNVGIPEYHVNHSTEKGGLAIGLWQPTEKLALKATFLLQDIDAANLNGVTVNGQTLDPIYIPPGINAKFENPFKQNMRLYSLSANWDLGFATLTSISGFSDINSDSSSDLSSFGRYCVPKSVTPTWPGCQTYPYPTALVKFVLADHVSKTVEEARLSSPNGQRFQWMIGGFYTRENTNEVQALPTFTPAYTPLPPVDSELNYLNKAAYKETAGFANIGLKITDRFEIGGGARRSAYSETGCPVIDEGLFGAGSSQPCTSLPSTDVTVWMADASFHLDPNGMFYGRVSTGYRPGSGCPTCGNTQLKTPGIVNPDRTTNYEGGFKGQFLERRLQMDFDAFYIDWKDIQLSLVTSTGIGYPGNGGSASSSGFELTSAYLITQALSLNMTMARVDAHLTQTVLGVGGDGDRLPISPLWTGSAALDYSRPLDSSMSLVLGAAYQYRDSVRTQLNTQLGYYSLRPEHIANVYAGLVINSVTLRLYGTNVFNNRSYSGGAVSNGEPTLTPIQPATVGLSLDYRFQ